MISGSAYGICVLIFFSLNEEHIGNKDSAVLISCFVDSVADFCLTWFQSNMSSPLSLFCDCQARTHLYRLHCYFGPYLFSPRDIIDKIVFRRCLKYNTGSIILFRTLCTLGPCYGDTFTALRVVLPAQ